MDRTPWRPRHPFCAYSHGWGALLFLVGAVVLLVLNWDRPLHRVAFAIYGLALVGLYLASTLYHSLQGDEGQERMLRNFDHAGIFLLIAGTYVPVCLIALPPALGDALLIGQAVGAAIGISATFALRRFPSVLNVVLYLLMGWMALLAVGYMESHWPGSALHWLLAGGIFYTVGAVVFSLDRPHLIPGRFTAHDLWHVFVLAGSSCHFLLMSTYLTHLQ